MTDEQLFSVIFPLLNTMLPVYGLHGVIAEQGYQESVGSKNSEPTVVIHKLFDRRRGFPKREDSFNGTTIVHTETVEMESHFQAGALGSVNGVTTSDILNKVAMILQSDAALRVFGAAGIGILRIGDIRQVFFKDDASRYAAEPSFDFVLCHQHVFVSSSPKVDDFTFQIDRI